MLLLTALACLGVLIFVAVYFASLRQLTVTYQNIHDVSIYKSSALDAGKGLKPAATITRSGEVIKLPKGTYTVHYTGDEGYLTRFQEFKLSKNQEVRIDPDYSEARLASLLKEEQGSIHQAVLTEYPNTALYAFKGDKLYKKGDWFGAALIYQGTDIFNFDTVRVIAHKENGVWKVSTSPPTIVIDKYTYPDIPVEVLRDVNSIE